MSPPHLGLRFFQTSRAAFQNATAPLRRQFARHTGRRFQSTESAAAEAAAAGAKQSFLQRSWNSPIGVKTVHFWLVIFFFFFSDVGGLGVVVVVGLVYWGVGLDGMM